MCGPCSNANAIDYPSYAIKKPQHGVIMSNQPFQHNRFMTSIIGTRACATVAEAVYAGGM